MVRITGADFTRVRMVSIFNAATGNKISDTPFAANSPTQITATVNLAKGSFYFLVVTSAGTSNPSPTLFTALSQAPDPVPEPTPTPDPGATSSGSVPTVGFSLTTATGDDKVGNAYLEVKLSQASDKVVTVDYAATGGTAIYGVEYKMTSGTLIFQPGTTVNKIPIAIYDTGINQLDGTIIVTLSHPVNAQLGGDSTETYTITDGDRKVLVSVKDPLFDAKGDGVTDDTFAIQKAVDYTYANGGGVIIFPTGTYVIQGTYGVKIRENITYQGIEGAILTRPAMQPKWTTTFTNESNVPSGPTDSKPLVIKGLTFDGNFQNQGPYQDYELEHSNLVFLCGPNPATSPGRLRVIVKDCTFKNSVSDGLGLHDNLYATISNCTVENCFRGGLVTGGRKMTVEVDGFTSKGMIDPTGIHLEDTYDSHFNFNNVNLIQGKFNIGVSDSTTVVGNNITGASSISIVALNGSTVKITNSELGVHPNDNILFPNDVTFDNCTFYATHKPRAAYYDKNTPHAETWISAAPFAIFSTSFDSYSNQKVIYNNCKFAADETISSSEKVYGIYTDFDKVTLNNVVTINGGNFSNKLNAGIVMKAGGNLVIRNATIDAALPFILNGYISNWGDDVSFNVLLDGIKINSSAYAHIVGLGSSSTNKLTQQNIVIDQANNYLASVYGLEGNQYVGNRNVSGTNPPTPATHGLIGDIYTINNEPSKRLICQKPGYARVDYAGNLINNVGSNWLLME